MKNMVRVMATVLMCVCGVASANITYNVNISGGGETVTGTITTDGHTGVLVASDFVSWSLSASGPITFDDVGPPIAAICPAAGCGIDVVGGTMKYQGTATTYLTLDEPPPGGFVTFDEISVTAASSQGFQIIEMSELYTVGIASVPEPPTAILLGIALACLGLACKRARGRRSAAV